MSDFQLPVYERALLRWWWVQCIWRSRGMWWTSHTSTSACTCRLYARIIKQLEHMRRHRPVIFPAPLDASGSSSQSSPPLRRQALEISQHLLRRLLRRFCEPPGPITSHSLRPSCGGATVRNHDALRTPVQKTCNEVGMRCADKHNAARLGTTQCALLIRHADFRSAAMIKINQHPIKA